MERSIIDHPVNSGDTLMGNPDPSSAIEKEQRLIVGSSEPKRRRPGKGLWFDGEVCGICQSNKYKHHAKGICRMCYRASWYSNHPGALSRSNKVTYLSHRIARIEKVRAYYEKNRASILERTRNWYRNKSYGGNMIVALERDGYACRNVNCPCNTPRLDVHHIDGRGANHPQPNHDPANLLTFCASCHARVSMGQDIVWSILESIAVYGRDKIVVVYGYGVANHAEH